jgi:antitoxin component YwqK of YwqJK toxin-antitoxin module
MISVGSFALAAPIAPEGVHTEYYENGGKKLEINLKEGTLIRYDEAGKVIEEKKNINQPRAQVNQKAINSSDEKQNKTEQTPTDNKWLIEDGIIRTYHPNGKLAVEGTMTDGLTSTYYDDGSKRGEGSQTGIWKEYYRSGKIKSEKDNIKKTYKEFFESGLLKTEISAEGTLKEYQESGKLKMEINPKNNIRKLYDENGAEITPKKSK